MKVLYATMQYGRGYRQGTERYVSILTEGLHKRGHSAVVLAGDPEHRGSDTPLGSVVDGEASMLHYPSRGWMAVEGLPTEQLKPVLDRVRPDIVHVANPAHIGVGLLGAARDLGIPTVVTTMDYWWLCPGHTLHDPSSGLCEGNAAWRVCARCMMSGHTSRVVQGLSRVPLIGGPAVRSLMVLRAMTRGLPRAEIERWRQRRNLLIETLDGVGAIIFPSQAARETIGPRVGHRRMYSIPYGLEARWFETRRPPISDGSAIRPDELTIGYAGALAAHKGVHLILQAVRDLGWTGTRIRLAGGGAETRYVERLRRLADGLNVEFVGQVASEEMPGFFGSIDVLVVPSTWPENLPIVVLEALAVGVPVLASRVGGIVEIIADPSHQFDVDSVSSQADRLDTWARHPSASETGQVSTADQMTEQTLDVYQQCLG